MTIPKIRERLCELTVRLDEIAQETKDALEQVALELCQLAEATKRKPPAKPIAKPRSQRMTAQLGRQIRNDIRLNPNVSEQALANKYGVNPGRISEALTGKW